MGLNTLQDTKKKQQLPVKDNFWPAARSKQGMEAWFKDLAGSKPLANLSKKVPTFNKKEEIFSTLCEYSVPLVRAAWFIKMTAAHNMATQDSRIRRRQAADQSIDWTQSLTKYLREQLQKIQEHYNVGSSGPQTSFLIATPTSTQADMEQALKQWTYCTRLAKHMYNEGLLDRHDTLTWLVELLDKMKNADDTVLKLLLAQIEKYLDEICLTALLSRKLAYFCCKRLQQMCSDAGSLSPRTQSPMVTANGSGAITTTSNNQYHSNHPFAAVFADYRDCPQHRSIILRLCAIVQTATLRCPTALVWNWLGDGKTVSFLCGSPLDILPCAPSSLPMLPGSQNQLIRSQIRAAENLIKQRGRAAEVNWSSDKCQQSATGYTISKVLHVLDVLDRHCFDRVDSNNSLDILYNKILAISTSKDGNEAQLSDEPVIKLLIDWAVSTQRTGEHRAVVTAKLLERRQNELRAEKYGDSEMMDDKESTGSDGMVAPGVPPFQQLLMEVLDSSAPLLEDHSSEDEKQAFRNLILLFHELILHDVFSHDAYMCTLISRGDLLCSPSLMQAADSAAPSSVKSPSESMRHEHQDDIKVDMDIHTMESDLSSLFGSVKDDNRSSPEPPVNLPLVEHISFLFDIMQSALNLSGLMDFIMEPSASNLRWDPNFMSDIIASGKCQYDMELVKQLNENPPNRYSFVCNAMLAITASQSPERLNEISLLCAELTAHCNALSSDWLGVLKFLCCSSVHSSGFIDVLTQIDVSDLSIHDSLAVFTAILIARHCFSLQDLIYHVALPSLMAACPSAGGDQDAEPGARLSCHLLLRLFKPSHLTSEQVTGPYTTKTVPMVQASSDRHLLEASHHGVELGPMSAVLKAMLILGDESSEENKKSGSSSQKDRGGDISSLLRNLDEMDPDFDMMLGQSSKGGMESKGLNDFAKHALQEVCRQDWVRDKFFKDPQALLNTEMLIDPMLTEKQAQQLLHTICHSEGLTGLLDVSDSDYKQLINRVLQNLDQWSLRVSWLELQLLLKQASTQAETNSILDHIARGTIDLFHQQTEIKLAGGSSPQEETKVSSDQDIVWLVGPLISRLPSPIQGRVLKLAGQVLESGNNLFVSAKSKQEKDRNQKSKSLLGHQPFLSLVQTCLKGQDEQREGLLNSLMSQLEKFINNTKEILKELGDKHTDATDRLRQLLPLPKRFYEVISVEPYGTLVDTKGNKITGFDSIAKKQGLQVGQKIKMSPWEVIEGHKNSAPISWAYFGAIRLEKKTLTYEDQHRLLLYHTHNMQQPRLPLPAAPAITTRGASNHPPEKVEEKPKEIMDVQTQDNNKKKNSKRRRPKPNTPGTYSVVQQQQMRPYYPETMYPPPGPHSSWYPAQQPKPYFAPQTMTPRPRFMPNSMPNSKAVISTMLQQRMNNPGPMQPHGPAHMPQTKHQNVLLRQHILGKRNIMDGNQPHINLYPNGGGMPPNTPQGVSRMMAPSQGVQGNYYHPMQAQQQGMMDPMNSGMMSPGFNQPSYTPPQGGPMMQGMGQQPGYMHPMGQGQQFPAAGRCANYTNLA
nr:hypothetical protein BaRGS_009504 [Batillaria attramentaria]